MMTYNWNEYRKQYHSLAADMKEIKNNGGSVLSTLVYRLSWARGDHHSKIEPYLKGIKKSHGGDWYGVTIDDLMVRLARLAAGIGEGIPYGENPA